MKLRHLLMTIAFALAIGFSMGCDFSEDDPGGNGNGGNGGSGSNDDPFTVKDAAGWERVLKVIQEGGNNKNYTITVTGDFSVPGKGEGASIFFGYNSDITVTIQGNGTISLSSAGICCIYIEIKQSLSKTLPYVGLLLIMQRLYPMLVAIFVWKEMPRLPEIRADMG